MTPPTSPCGESVRHFAGCSPSTLELTVVGEEAVMRAKGPTNAEIGRKLHISEATVKTHLPRTFGKLDVSDRTAAVTTAMALDLLP